MAASFEAVAAARRCPGCLDFFVGADLIEADRVNVYERWSPPQNSRHFVEKDQAPT